MSSPSSDPVQTPDDPGIAIAAHLDRPHGAAIAPDGSLWIGDTNNHRLRRVGP
jgi:streptogramin lyase